MIDWLFSVLSRTGNISAKNGDIINAIKMIGLFVVLIPFEKLSFVWNVTLPFKGGMFDTSTTAMAI